MMATNPFQLDPFIRDQAEAHDVGVEMGDRHGRGGYPGRFIVWLDYGEPRRWQVTDCEMGGQADFAGTDEGRMGVEGWIEGRGYRS